MQIQRRQSLLRRRTTTSGPPEKGPQPFSGREAIQIKYARTAALFDLAGFVRFIPRVDRHCRSSAEIAERVRSRQAPSDARERNAPPHRSVSVLRFRGGEEDFPFSQRSGQNEDEKQIAFDRHKKEKENCIAALNKEAGSPDAKSLRRRAAQG
uniref:Uncharacterized protein n=1 Tax=Pseudictyota dubia TaxID=2749911 RepID=A0A7R9ZA05_9STRA